jgi:hypothetical protein
MVAILPGPPLPSDPVPEFPKPDLFHRILVKICKCRLCKLANFLHKLYHKKDDFECYPHGYRLTATKDN